MVWSRDNIPKITETRNWSLDQVREVCIRHGYYTRGTNEEYDLMLKLVRLMGPTEEGLYSIALDIARHTVNWDDLSEWDKLGILEDIMDCLDKGAVIHFYHIEEESHD